MNKKVMKYLTCFINILLMIVLPGCVLQTKPESESQKQERKIDSTLKNLIRKYPEIPFSAYKALLDTSNVAESFWVRKKIYNATHGLTIEMRQFERCGGCETYTIFLITDYCGFYFALPFNDNIFYWRYNSGFKYPNNKFSYDDMIEKLNFKNEMHELYNYMDTTEITNKWYKSIKLSALTDAIIHDMMNSLLDYQFLTVQDTAKIKAIMQSSPMNKYLGDEEKNNANKRIDTVINELKKHDYSFKYYLVNNTIYKFHVPYSKNMEFDVEVINWILYYEPISF